MNCGCMIQFGCPVHNSNITIEPTWMIECRSGEVLADGSNAWVLTLAKQADGICMTCKRSIFGNKDHRA